GYFLAFYGKMLIESGEDVMPEGVFVLAAAVRWVAVAALCLLVIRDIRHPHLDPVRAHHPDDPDGGIFDGAADHAPAAPSAQPAAHGRAQARSSYSEQGTPTRSSAAGRPPM